MDKLFKTIIEIVLLLLWVSIILFLCVFVFTRLLCVGVLIARDFHCILCCKRRNNQFHRYVIHVLNIF